MHSGKLPWAGKMPMTNERRADLLADSPLLGIFCCSGDLSQVSMECDFVRMGDTEHMGPHRSCDIWYEMRCHSFVALQVINITEILHGMASRAKLQRMVREYSPAPKLTRFADHQ